MLVKGKTELTISIFSIIMALITKLDGHEIVYGLFIPPAIVMLSAFIFLNLENQRVKHTEETE